MAQNGSGLDYSDDHPTGPRRPNPFTQSSTINLDDNPSTSEPDRFSVEQPDGSVVVNIFDEDGDQQQRPEPLTTGFSRNLADEMSEDELAKVSAELIEGIDADIDSRKEWMDTRAKGIRMLALVVEEPQQGIDFGPTSAPLEGQSRVRHNIMLEATVAFQAGARGELLPAAGPVKIQNVTPTASPQGMPDSGAPTDELATAFEQDMNYWLMDVAREYVPDTDRMFFQVGWSGDGFKKSGRSQPGLSRPFQSV